MASSSQFPRIKYDVFISFRGTDVRFGFLSHLTKELQRKQIDAYVDDKLKRGDEISPSLLRAIEESLISLIIFSKDYASSRWCLEELEKIIECMDRYNQILVPVFYKTDPSDVRHQRGFYADALAKHDKTYKEKVQNWRSALNKAANSSGFPSSDYGNEAELIEDIVKCVITKLDHIYQNESDSKGFVGIRKRVGKVESLLSDESQDVRFIGIWGMGGIGKTTVAAAIFNKFCFAYEGSCFLANVREESKRYGITHLKSKLISILLGDKESVFSMPYGGTPYAMRRLSRKKVLVVLDDIDDHEQLETLAGGHHWFGLGSKVIITTRDKQVLSKEVDYMYKMDALNFVEAFRLFSLNAFKNDGLDIEFKELARKVVDYANGIPLALKVLGCFLYGKSKEEWGNQLEKLKRMPYTKVQHVLKLSFDGLDYEEKNIFLDIACFFKGENVEGIKILLDACGYSTIIGLRSLVDKALLTISKDRVFMHDLIQEMGWKIVREESIKDPGKRSRLWDPNDIFQVLNNNTGTDAIEGITLDISKMEELHLNPQVFSRMCKLKFLHFYSYSPNHNNNRLHFPLGLESLPNELRLLHWYEYPSKSLPNAFSGEKLISFEMPNSQLRKLWDGVQNLVNLRLINVSESKDLIELPDFSKALHLEQVNLMKCSKLSNVPPSILCLPNLEALLLKSCKSLTSLTSNTPLRSLRLLTLHGCLRLTEFSVTSEKKLILDLSKTAINNDLPSSGSCLSNIQSLTLNDCTNLMNLPFDFSELSNTIRLSIEGCNKLASNLRFLFEGLRSLTMLSLDNCSNLYEIPKNISMLSSLRELSIAGTNVESLPISIKHLSRLYCLYVNDCRRLQSLPELPPSMLDLNSSNCTSLQTLQLTSTNAVILEDEDQVIFDFRNCVKLDQQSAKSIEAKAVLEMNKYVSAIGKGIYWRNWGRAIYPGSKVPEWFIYRTTQSPVVIDLSSIPQSKDWTFFFCVVVSQSPSSAYIGIAWDFSNGERVCEEDDYHVNASSILSDHVFLWFVSELPSQVQTIIEECRADDESSSDSIKLSIQLMASTDKGSGIDKTSVEIKEFGVCPTYASEYQNFIEQMELRLKPQSSGIGLRVGCSYDNTDEKEAVPQKSNDFIFPTPPSGTWKNTTQGLKDILFQ